MLAHPEDDADAVRLVVAAPIRDAAEPSLSWTT